MTDYELMIMFAFRYCLGRRTYAPSTFISYVSDKAVLDKLSPECLKAMANEINEASVVEGALGDDCDATMWRNFSGMLLKTVYEIKG